MRGKRCKLHFFPDIPVAFDKFPEENNNYYLVSVDYTQFENGKVYICEFENLGVIGDYKVEQDILRFYSNKRQLFKNFVEDIALVKKVFKGVFVCRENG